MKSGSTRWKAGPKKNKGELRKEKKKRKNGYVKAVLTNKSANSTDSEKGSQKNRNRIGYGLIELVIATREFLK